MNDGIYINTDLINGAYRDIKRAYKILTTNNIQNITSSIEKMEIIKDLASYKYLGKLKDEIDDLIIRADKIKDKCKNLASSSIRATDFSGFTFSGIGNMNLLMNAVYQKAKENKEERQEISKKAQDELSGIKLENPNYQNNLDVYVSEIKENLGIDEIEKKTGMKISTPDELIQTLETLKKGMKDNKTEIAQIESILKQLKRYNQIDKYERGYTESSEYNNGYMLNDDDRLEQKIQNQDQVYSSAAISTSSVYIEYKDIKDYLSKEQQEIMSYIYKTKGAEESYKYYELLTDQINQLKGMEKAVEKYKKLKETGKKAGSTTTTSSYENIYGGSSYKSEGNYYNAKKKSQEYMTEYMHSIMDGTINGLEGFKESFQNINNGNATELDYERMYLIEAFQNDKELAKGLEETYGFGESIGNMLPTVTAGTIISISTGGAGAPVAMKALQTVGTGSMIFGNSYGSKKHQNLLNGYTEEDSKKNAVISALSETILEESLGTLPGVGKQGKNILMNMFKEGGQEAIQQFTENLGDHFTLDSIDLNDCLLDTGKAFVYGALISGTMEAGQTIIYKGTQIVINNDTLSRLKTAINHNNQIEVQDILKELPEQDLNSRLIQLEQKYSEDYAQFIAQLNEAIRQTHIGQGLSGDNYAQYTEQVLNQIQNGQYTAVTSTNGWRTYIQTLYENLCTERAKIDAERRNIRVDSKTNRRSKESIPNLGKSYSWLGMETRDFGTTRLNFYKLKDQSTGITIYSQVEVNNQKSNVDYLDVDVLAVINEIESYDKRLISNLKKVYITDIANPNDSYWSKIHNTEFYSAATGGNGEITIYKYSTRKEITNLVYHESAHTFDKNYKISNSKEWKKAVEVDNNFPTQYAKSSYEKRKDNRYAEDFADSVAQLRGLGFTKFSQKYPNRANILKKKLPDLCKRNR